MTQKDKQHFLKTFGWYRGITLGIIDQIPEDFFAKRLSEKSLTLYCQLVDLGDMQLHILGRLLGKELRTEDVHILLDSRPSKAKLKEYLLRCHATFEDALFSEKIEGKTLDWYGRFSFDGAGTLYFLLAHESLHHGEILSLIYSLGLPMPKAFQDTWGMC